MGEFDMSLLLPLIFALHPPVIVPPDQGEAVAVPFHPVRRLLSQTQSPGAVTIYEFDVPPKSAGAPPHIHGAEDEYFYVLEGEASVLDRDEVVTAGPGALAALTRGNLHAFWNAGEAPLKLLVIVSGDNRFEGFFDAVAARLREEAPEGPEAAGALIGKIAQEHDITIRMDALPEEAKAFYQAP